MLEKAENIQLLFDALNSNNINYILIKNINNELPAKLKTSKDVDLLINQNSMNQFHSVMNKIARKVIHPYSKNYGWRNLYDLPEFEFWRMFKGEDLLVDITYRLCCRSLVPKIWIPLDEIIQKSAWENKTFDSRNGWWRLDKNTQFVYYIVRCVFDKAFFSDVYIQAINELQDNIDICIVEMMLDKVFFGFTKELLDLIKDKKFNEIRNKFIAFSFY